MLTFGSLFAGIGGLDLGLERVGMKCLWQVEIDKYAMKVLEKNFPNAKKYGDIDYIDFNKIEYVDVICGGFPCQDISKAGKGVGIEGDRSGLWKKFKTAISEVRPRYVIVENVSMLLQRGLNVVLGDLSEIGYDTEWFTLCASDFGALHKRERIFIIAYPNMHRCSIQTDDNKKSGMRASRNVNGECSAISKNISISKRNKDKFPFVANDWIQRIQRFKQESLQGKQGFSWCKDVRRIEDFKGRQDIPEPLFRGSSDGISNWMDRIKCLGNSVVPQVAEFIGQLIVEYDKNNM